MKSKIYWLVLVLMVFAACKEPKDKSKIVQEVVKVETKIKTTTSLYEDLDGNPISLTDFKGKRVLLNFWATWCRPCIEEMPSLLKAQEVLEKEDYVFLLATDQSVKIINAFKVRKGFEFTYLRYTGAFADLGINALPKTFIYNKNGDKVDEISGAVEWDSQEMINRLKAIK